MTTPERLRRRQRRESAFIAILALALVLGWLYFKGQGDAQRACLSAFVSNTSETSAIRSRILERESDANRRVIRTALRANSRDDIKRARERYDRSLRAIDQARASNPVKALPEGVCD